VTTWVITPAETTQVYSPVGLHLLDELTNEAPIGNVNAFLDLLGANNVWQQTSVQPSVGPSGILTYPGLEFHGNATGLPARQYRIRMTADYYVPFYLAKDDGIAFTAYPYDQTNPPQTIASVAQDTPLLPAPNYPFASHIPVLRGVVVDATNKPVPNAYVTQGNTERALTDVRGTFALPLRWVQSNVQTPIDAVDQRTNRIGTIQIQLPGALARSQTIPIS
jgi:hypothetical protein